MSASAMDSEADFARLADNLALKSDGQGAFSFDHRGSRRNSTGSDIDVTPVRPHHLPLHVVARCESEKASSSSSRRPTAARTPRVAVSPTPQRPLLELRTAIVRRDDPSCVVSSRDVLHSGHSSREGSVVGGLRQMHPYTRRTASDGSSPTFLHDGDEENMVR